MEPGQMARPNRWQHLSIYRSRKDHVDRMPSGPNRGLWRGQGQCMLPLLAQAATLMEVASVHRAHVDDGA
jgi:hypothetical protein